MESLRIRLPAAVLAVGLGGSALVGCTPHESTLTPLPAATAGPVTPNSNHTSWDFRAGAPIFADARRDHQCAETSREAAVVPEQLQDLAGGRELFIMNKSDLHLTQPNTCPATVYTDGK
jgi:hypothetical protein